MKKAKKILSLFLVTIITAGIMVSCGENKKSANENKVYKAGEEAIIKHDGKDMYSLKIDSVKKANDFEYKEDFKDAKEIIEVTYTYKNLNKNDNTLYIHGADLQVADSKGTIANSSDMFPKGKPKELTPGTNCTVNAYYGLTNESNKVKIIFSSEAYGQNLEFDANVEK